MSHSQTDEELFRAFEAGTFDPKLFSHEMHIRVGWVYVCCFPRAEAIERFAAKLKAWATALGIPGKYHESITWFYMLIIDERQSEQSATTFEEFIAKNADLISGKPTILERYYRAETLKSAHARNHYVLPDRLEAYAAA